MTHYLLGQLAAQRQTQSANRAAWERHTSPTRPISASSRRRAASRPLSALAGLVGRA
jgi:hypothetical protein